MSEPVANDFAAIRSRLKELGAPGGPMCPTTSTRRLYDCLRSTNRCPDTCPLRGDWIGPQE